MESKLSQHTPVESALKMGLIFSDFENYSKSAPGKISLSIVLVLYTYEIGKTAKKTRVMSILPYTTAALKLTPHRLWRQTFLYWVQ